MIESSKNSLEKIKEHLTFIENFDCPFESGNWASYQIKDIDPDVMRFQILNSPELEYDWWRFIYYDKKEQGWYAPIAVEDNIFSKYVKDYHCQYEAYPSMMQNRDRIRASGGSLMPDTPEEWFMKVFEQLQSHKNDIIFDLFDFDKELALLGKSLDSFNDWRYDYEEQFNDVDDDGLQRIFILQEKTLILVENLGLNGKSLANEALENLALNL